MSKQILFQRLIVVSLTTLITLGVMTMLVMPRTAYAATFVVTKTADTNDGTCDSDCSLREALTAANATAGADMITFNVGGTFAQGSGLTASDSSGLTIDATGQTVVVQGNNTFRILNVSAGPITLIGFTIQNGNAGGGNGGGLNSGSAVLDRMSFLTNTAGTSGGGAYIGGNATVTGTTFSGNTSSGNEGGGARFFGITSVINTTFISNTAGWDGGGAWFGGATTITGTAFSGNVSAAGGGGAWFGSTTNMTGTAFSGNSASLGGGAFFENANAKQLVNMLFARNRATTSGAAVYVGNSNPLSLIHSTIVSPTLPTGAAAAVHVGNGTIYITNTIVASHTTGIQQAGGTVTAWNTLFSNVGSQTAGTVTNNIPVVGNAGFVNPAADDYHITSASAAVNAGTIPTPNVPFDIDGQARPLSGGYDIGYDEILVFFTCYATPDNGTTLFGSNNAQAVRDALGAASPGGTVKVAGTCAGTISQSGSPQVALITQTLTLAGGYTSTNWTTAYPLTQPTTLDAQNGGRVLKATVAVTLTDLTVRGGSYASTDGLQGGGAYFGNATALNGVTFISNTVHTNPANGGGAYFNSTATVVNSAFVSNTALVGNGGGASIIGNATVTGTTFMSNTAGNSAGAAFGGGLTLITNTTFSNNTAVSAQGGGAYFSGGGVNIVGVTFSGNQALASGAVFLNVGSVSISGTTFSNNRATAATGDGGAIALNAGALFITNTTFMSNTAPRHGGGIGIFAGAVTRQLVNVLFAGNAAGSNGAAMYVSAGSPVQLIHVTVVSPTVAGNQAVYVNPGATVYLTNTIVASHTVGIDNTAGGTVAAWNTLFSGVTTQTVGTVTNNNPVVGNPAFANPAANDYHLTSTSAAIDVGVIPSPNITFDIDGQARPLRGGYDIGYDETVNQAPTANAGSDQSVSTNATVTLDGSASSDPEGDVPLTYQWTQTGGSAVTLSDSTAVTPTFTAPGDPAVITFTLTVTDSYGLAAPATDEVVITVNNQAPTANAGPDQSGVATNATVTLDGSGSSDLDDDTPLTYQWTQTGGPAVTLSDSTVVSPTFTAPGDPGVITFTLTVTDSLGLADSTPDEVVITVNNQAPTANAGSDQSVSTNATVTLDGSASSDLDGDTPLTYQWTQTGGPAVTLSDSTVVSPTFTAPGDPAVITFTLAVTDSLGLAASTTDEVVITVNNQAPVADAGSDQTGLNPNVTVTLDGSASSDLDGDTPLTYLWTQTGGPAVTLSDSTAATPTFTAPSAVNVLTFTLTVTDSLGLADSTPDEVLVAVGNQAPVANAGNDQSIGVNATVTLDGSGSNDADGHLPLSYLWTQTGGPAVTLSDSTGVTPTFSAPSAQAVLTFTLIVTDSLGLADTTPDEVVITVTGVTLYLPIIGRNTGALQAETSLTRPRQSAPAVTAGTPASQRPLARQSQPFHALPATRFDVWASPQAGVARVTSRQALAM